MPTEPLAYYDTQFCRKKFYGLFFGAKMGVEIV